MYTRGRDSSDPYNRHCKDPQARDDCDGSDDCEDIAPDFVAPYCWCTEFAPMHYGVIDANMADALNTQLRDIANFFVTVSAELPSDVAVNDARTEIDLVGWFIDALDNERWQVTAGHSSRMSTDLDAMDLNELYRKFNVEEYSGGIPDEEQAIDSETELYIQTAIDVWSAISIKLVDGLAE